jgi:hypothetical protein
MNDGDGIFCPHCYTIELEASDMPVWATDQVERWAWICAGCGYTYIWDEIWPIDDQDYEMAAWLEHIQIAWELQPERDMWQICESINEHYPFQTLFSGKLGEAEVR